MLDKRRRRKLAETQRGFGATRKSERGRYGNQFLAEGNVTNEEKPSYNSFQKSFWLQHENVLRSGSAG